MSVTNWLFGTCGKSHIGVYVCSRCGYELLRSGFERNFVLRSPNLQGLLPLPVTVAAAKGQALQTQNEIDKSRKANSKNSRIISSTPFIDSMLEDFTKNANLARTFHKNSLVKRIIEGQENSTGNMTKYEISCGKCGSSLGTQVQLTAGAGQAKFVIKKDRVDLTFRST